MGFFGFWDLSKFRTLRFFLMEKIVAFSLDRKSWDILCVSSNPCFFIKLPINLGIPILSHVSQPLHTRTIVLSSKFNQQISMEISSFSG